MASREMTTSITAALGDYGDDYDTDAIAAELAGRGHETADDIDPAEFWELVEAHPAAAIDETSPLEAFKAELSAALLADRPIGAPAVWRRGGVTLSITGASRVNTGWPQHGARITATIVGSAKTKDWDGWHIDSWPNLWARVERLLQDWTEQVAGRRNRVDQARRTAEKLTAEASTAQAALRLAETELDALVPDGETGSPTMTRDDVARYLGIAPGSVRKQMSRWGIAAVGYERGGTPGPAEARYPTADIQAAAGRRPGRGHRSDLADNTQP